jgi:hypothetical protein
MATKPVNLVSLFKMLDPELSSYLHSVQEDLDGSVDQDTQDLHEVISTLYDFCVANPGFVIMTDPGQRFPVATTGEGLIKIVVDTDDDETLMFSAMFQINRPRYIYQGPYAPDPTSALVKLSQQMAVPEAKDITAKVRQSLSGLADYSEAVSTIFGALQSLDNKVHEDDKNEEDEEMDFTALHEFIDVNEFPDEGEDYALYRDSSTGVYYRWEDGEYVETDVAISDDEDLEDEEDEDPDDIFARLIRAESITDFPKVGNEEFLYYSEVDDTLYEWKDGEYIEYVEIDEDDE